MRSLRITNMYVTFKQIGPNILKLALRYLIGFVVVFVNIQKLALRDLIVLVVVLQLGTIA